LRHRRRNNTQTILRKSTTNKTRFISPKKKRSKKPLFYTLLIVVCISLIFIYKNEISGFYNSLMASSKTSETTQQVDKEQPKAEEPSIPAAEEKVQQQLYYSPLEKKIQLEILNGCGESGVAKKLSDLLKKSTYDIVNSGNYIERGKINWNVAETRIISQVSNPQNARDLADVMGVLYSNVEIFENPSPIADITVVIGKDYNTLAIFQ
jgi:hypothetical protein